MKTLTIKDLSRTEQLEHSAMAAVHGGWSMFAPSYHVGDVSYAPSADSSITATQNLLQQQGVTTATANGAAFINGVHVDSDVRQNGKNTIIG
jgi:hypothetical protein